MKILVALIFTVRFSGLVKSAVVCVCVANEVQCKLQHLKIYTMVTSVCKKAH